RLEASTLTMRAGRIRRVEPFYVLPPQTTVPPLPAPSRPNPLLAAAGDVACYPGEPRTPERCHHEDTSDQLVNSSPDVVALLGDAQYDRGTLEEFAEYDRTWGRVKDRTRPAIGNHEYLTDNAAPYFTYFGQAAGAPDRAYYSYDLGTWHVVVLNSNCAFVSCLDVSSQVRWLRADLAAHPRQCTLAYWHHPRHSSAQRLGHYAAVRPLWRAAAEGGVDVVLAGHVHNYERLAPLDADGRIDPENGIRSFVVGTGGRNYQRMSNLKPFSESANADTFGVLFMSLRPDGYGWLFGPEPGDDFTDSGTGSCH
nr:metallophosphoesterase [Actinomycetota bacterium]